MKKVGFYKELQHGDENGGSIIEALSSNTPANLLQIVNYLDHGHFFIISPTVVTDVLTEREVNIGTLAIQTDGVWAWPSDLVYYVKNYGISLPHDFVRHMAENLWVVADVDLSNLKL